jgi:hypothetical protein
VIKSVPTGREVVLKDARKRPPAAGATLAVPSVVLPVTKVTVPVGMPTPAKPMATVKETVPPGRELYGLVNGAVMAMAEAVGAVLTVTVKTDDTLPAKVVVPR